MNDSSLPRTEAAHLNRDEMMSALFASMVMQQANMAMLYLGQMPHPETGQPTCDLDAARMFIDQLEMLEFKTRGNLSKDEAALLKQSLSSARMAFVQAVESAQKEKPVQPPGTAAPPDAKSEPAAGNQPPSEGSSTPADEARKKFVKKY